MSIALGSAPFKCVRDALYSYVCDVYDRTAYFLSFQVFVCVCCVFILFLSLALQT